MRKINLLLLFIGLIFVIAACGGGDQNDDALQSLVVTDEDKEAYEIYKQSGCINCHASDLSGTMGESNLQEVGSRLSQEEIYNVIMNGTGNIMPAHKDRIDEESIQLMSVWLAKLK